MTDAMKIALTGMNNATLRIATAANNIANASTVGQLPSATNPDATSYVPQDVVNVSQDSGNTSLGVSSTTAARQPSYTTESDPSSPDANAQGLVAAPNVDITDEVVSMQMAETAYRASADIVKTVSDNEKKLIDAVSA
jgi:flagellar basal-body rod protein FlgC